MAICKVFKFINLNDNSPLYLNGPDSADPDKLLHLYINWYNNDFITEKEEKKFSFEFRFEGTFCPIDFYDDYQEIKIV